MMYTRKKVLYNLIKELGNPSNVVIQKSMFLLTRGNYGCEGLYDFFPDKMGCYSIRLKTDYHSLADEDYLEEDYSTSKYKVKVKDEYNTRITFFVGNEIVEAIRKVAKLANGMEEEDFIRYAYEQDPYYAIRSEIVSSLKIGSDFNSLLMSKKRDIEESERALYTIGYEGRSIDGLLDELLRRNIKTLFDVRKNAFSMKREFSKQSLYEASMEAGIEYIHCPEVGIISGKRQELLPKGRQDELFEWYKENVLPKSQRFVDKAVASFKGGNIAFMCFEKNPMDCHRSRLADYCLTMDKSFPKVVHL